MANDQDFSAQIQQMINNMIAVTAMQKNIDTLDKFATAAMTEIMRARNTDLSFEEIARYAWEIADAMLAERRKRLEKDEPEPVV